MQIIPWQKNSQILQSISPQLILWWTNSLDRRDDLLMDFVIPHKKNNPRMELSSDPLFLD